MTMTRRERILAASRLLPTDRLPFFHYWRHSQIGWAERECRNRGMGMCWLRPCHVEHLHDVEVSEQQVSWHGPLPCSCLCKPTGQALHSGMTPASDSVMQCW